MRDKKHIDRSFQERFKDFEANPSDAVWKNIEAELNKKKKKHRVIPIWWRYAGVAALLLLLLTVGNLFINDSENIPTNQVVDTEDTTRSSQNTEEEKEDNGLNNLNENHQIVTNTNSEKDTLEKTLEDTSTENSSDKIKVSNETTVTETTNSVIKNKGSEKGNNSNSRLINKQKTLNIIVKPETSNIAANTSEEKNSETIKEVESIIDTKKVETILNNDSKNTSALAENETTKTDAIADDSIENTKLSIEDILDKTEEIIEEEEYLNRWSVTPNAAPVYFNSLGEGSSIDPQFNSNSKSGELNMSYGITASYAINNKLSIRSGIHKVNLGYNTNDVVVFQSISASSKSSSLQNINTNTTNNANNLEAASFADGMSVISGANLKNADSFTKSSITSINQSFGYIEIPLEIQYAISTKKLGIHVIGGFSSLFLNSNKVFSDLGDSRTLLGEANNINKVSYSANFGLGFNYKMSKAINLNLEPIFKYQINTFNNTSGDFKPYFIGVYTGFAIKF